MARRTSHKPKSFEPYSSEDDRYAPLRSANSEYRRRVARRNGKWIRYEKWSKEALCEHAAKLGIEGRTEMSRNELINALRNS